MEGHLNLRIAPWIRRLITRLMAIIPALLVVMAVLAAAPASAAKMPNGSYRQSCSNIKVKDASSKKPWLVDEVRRKGVKWRD